jgi:hypothetical protein
MEIFEVCPLEKSARPTLIVINIISNNNYRAVNLPEITKSLFKDDNLISFLFG